MTFLLHIQEAQAGRCSANSPGAIYAPATKTYMCDDPAPASKAPTQADMDNANSADAWMPNAPVNAPQDTSNYSNEGRNNPAPAPAQPTATTTSAPAGSAVPYTAYGASSGGCYSSYKNESFTSGAGDKDPFDPSRTCGSDGQWSGSSGGKDGNPSSSQTEYSQSDANEPCNSAMAQTKSFCTAANATGLQQQAAGIASMAAASSANAGAACTMQSKIAEVQALFNSDVAAACTAQIFSCRETCTPDSATVAAASNPQNPGYANAKLKVNSYTANKSTCSSMGFAAAQSALQATANGISAKAAGDCAKAYNAAVAAATPILAQTCIGNPNYAATHVLECYCASNPGDVKCLNASLGQNPGGLAAPLSGGLSRGGPAGDPGGGAGNGNCVAPLVSGPGGGCIAGPSTNPSTAGGGASGSGGGGGGGIGGGGPAGAAVAANAEDPGAGGASGNGGNIFGGFSAGQGGFSYGGHGAAASGGGGGVAGAMKALATKLNLNGLLPKRNDFVNRSVAGMSVSSADGVTGPNGPSIWEKVSRRYQIKKGELLPP